MAVPPGGRGRLGAGAQVHARDAQRPRTPTATAFPSNPTQPNPSRLEGLDWDSLNFTTLLVDPPRAGLDPATVQLLRDFQRVVYVSCNPGTRWVRAWGGRGAGVGACLRALSRAAGRLAPAACAACSAAWRRVARPPPALLPPLPLLVMPILPILPIPGFLCCLQTRWLLTCARWPTCLRCSALRSSTRWVGEG